MRTIRNTISEEDPTTGSSVTTISSPNEPDDFLAPQDETAAGKSWLLIGAIGLTSIVSHLAFHFVPSSVSIHRDYIELTAFMWTLLLVVMVGIVGGVACRWRLTFAGVAFVVIALPISMHLSSLAQRVPSLISMADPGTLIFNLLLSYCILMIPAGIAHGFTSLDRKVPRINLCRKCEYSLRGNVSGKCPECGTPVNQIEDVAAERGE